METVWIIFNFRGVIQAVVLTEQAALSWIAGKAESRSDYYIERWAVDPE